MPGELARVRFTIEGPPLSKNEIYLNPAFLKSPPKGKHDRIMTSEARKYANRVKGIARAAALGSEWPREIYAVRAVRVTVKMFNSRHDPGAADVLIRDALQKTLYLNDRCACGGPQDPPFQDGGKTRVEVDVELLDVYSDDEARHRRRAAEKRQRDGMLKKTRSAVYGRPA